MYLSFERAYPTPLGNSTLLPLLLLSLARQRHTPDTSREVKKEYDYIIVGSGSAGSVVASRLSELPCVSVLLLEAGHEPPLLTEVPALGESFWFTDLDWQYKTTPQKYTGRALVNRQIIMTSGKMLGGSSGLNSMLYVRGNRKNYDDWADQGAKGWSYKEVYPYFLKLENNKDRDFLANGYHTTGGPVSAHKPRYEPVIKRAVYQAATGMGYKLVDSNAQKQTGFYDFQATLKDNQRCSAAKAYLVPAENRTNLDILTNAMVTKIIIHNRQARGIQLDHKGHTYEVRARKEVIVSAGAVNTPQLLMLSGVGPKEELHKLKIALVADLPVGQNLQDHVGTDVSFVLKNPHVPDFREKLSDTANIHQYIRNRTGPLASADGYSFLAFLKGQAIYTPVDFPNYQLYFKEMTAAAARDFYGLKPEVYRRLYGPYEEQPLMVCRVAQLQPRSRGTVTLRSRNPYDPPIIDPKFLQDPRDVEDLVQGMKTCQRIGTSFPLSRLGARPFKTLIPGCEKYVDDDDRYFTCQARSIVISLKNPAGTVKMGDPRDETTVVDPQLRVKNIKGLRVVDASVMPIIPSGNTMIPTIMVAEKASEMIKETINCYRKGPEEWNEPTDSSEWSHEEDEERPIQDISKWDKSKESPWKNEFHDVQEHPWNGPKRESWIRNQKKSMHDYLTYPTDNSLQEKDHSKEEDFNTSPKHSWTPNGKYYLDDFIKDPDELSTIKDDKGSFWKPYEWYKKKTELILKEISEPPYTPWKNRSPYASSPWKNPYKVTQSIDDSYNTSKSIDEPYNMSKSIDDPYDMSRNIDDPYETSKTLDDSYKMSKPRDEPYKMSKSFEELIKLADMVPDEWDHNYKWRKSYAKPEVPWYH